VTGKNKTPKRVKKATPETMVINQPGNLPLPSPQPDAIVTPVKN